MFDNARHWITNNAASVTIGCLIVILLLSMNLMGERQRDDATPRPDMAWYYDTVEQRIFPAARDTAAPFVNDAGHECVRVYLWSCGDCADAEQRVVSHYEKHVEGYEQHLEQAKAAESLHAEDALLMVSADAVNWLPFASEEGRRLVNEARDRIEASCAERKPKLCLPRGSDL